MSKVQLATQISKEVKESLEAICEDRGFKIGYFIQEAILDKIEEIEDIENLKIHRMEKTRPLSKVIKDLEKRGKI